MEKKVKHLCARAQSGAYMKFLLRMRLTALLLTVVFLNVHASSLAQRVSYSGTNVPLKLLFNAIEKQTGYLVFGNEALIGTGRKVTIAAENLPLREFLDIALKNQPFTYQINSRTITFVPKKTEIIQNPAFRTEEAAFKLIRGKVVDSSGAPLEGVNILHQQKDQIKAYVKTDSKGEFVINADKGDQLTFSYLGFQPYVLHIDQQAFLSVTMQRQQQKLAEVTVTHVSTGYQKIKPEQSTGAVSVISTKAYESRVNTDFVSGLVNRLPGLMINNDVQFTSNVDGTASSNNLFNVRGISTISANQSPLIVLDGYPTELTLSSINPNEIESVTLLKDAAAATVYGVRASNGVIIIQRKQAAVGKPRFNFRSTLGIRPRENYTRYRWDEDASGINVKYNQTRYANSINNGSWLNLLTYPGTIYSPVFYAMAREAGETITHEQAEREFAELSGYDNEADYARLFLRPMVNQTYNFDVSGGSPGALYYITANYRKNRAQQINNDDDMFQLSGRTNLQLSKRLSLELNTDFSRMRNAAAPVPAIGSIEPYERLQDEIGQPLPVISNSRINPYYNVLLMNKGLLDNLYYPLADVHQISDKTSSSTNRITANFTYRIGRGFNFRFGGVYENSRSENKYYANEDTYVARQYVNSYTQLNATGAPTYHIPMGGILRQRNFGSTGYTFRAQLNYDKQIHPDHSVNGIIGAEVRELVEQSSAAAYFGYDDESLLQLPVNYGTVNSGFINPLIQRIVIDYNTLFNQAYVNNRFISGFSNIVYAFRNKYSLSGSLRVDQSNLFGTNPKYKYKPLWSIGAAWNVHREDFMTGLPWLNQLKLRVATGFNGNVAKNSLPRVIARSELNPYAQVTFPALNRESFANSALRWEQTNNFNAGIDIGIMQRINLTVEVYSKKSTDLLSNEKINPTLGNGPTYINAASIQNKGIELNLQADWIAKPGFNWNTGIIFAANNSKTLKVFQNKAFYPQALNSAGYLEGYPLAPLFAYRYAGIDDTGMPMVQGEKGEVYKTSLSNISSIMNNRSLGITYYKGTSIPRFNAGFSNRIDIGNLYVFTMINYYGGFKVLAPRPSPGESRPLEGAGTYWKQPGDERTSDVISLAAFASAMSRLAYDYADVSVVNGDYITLGDVTVSYNFAKYPMLKRLGFSLFELKAQASNVYTVGLNRFNYSKATGSFAKRYITPTYTIALFTNF